MGKGRAACCDKSKVKKGAWTPKEDLILTTFIRNHGHSNWRTLPLQAGLLRCGKSCRLRWINYLRPDVKRGCFTPQEELTIINLHYSFGNKWSKIASHLPGRTDNEIKNVWNTHLKKRVTMITKKNIAADNININININIGSKTNYSASSSCSITTSSGDHQEKMDKAIIDHHQGVHQDSGGPNNSEKPKFLDLKKSNENEPSISDDHSRTPTSSSYSSNYRPPNEVLECTINPNDDDGKIEIPLEESDIDFWELFDSLDELHNTGNHGSDLSNGVNENHDDVGIEGGEWNVRLLENELGLTGDDDVDNLPKDDDQNVVLTTQQQYYEEMHLETGIFPGILLDCFQI